MGKQWKALKLQGDRVMRAAWFNRWWGALGGTLIAISDMFTLRALGIAFEIGGRDVSWFVAVWFGSSLALAGFLAGYAFEMRRRVQRSGALVPGPEEEISATPAPPAQAERLAAACQAPPAGT